MVNHKRGPSRPTNSNYSQSSDPKPSSHVRVVIRVRPENEREQSGNHSTIIRVVDEQFLVFDPKVESSPEYFKGKRRRGRDVTQRKNRDLQYMFDRVFDEDATNQDVYEHTTKHIIDGLLDGYNCSVFAYGATGAGKTFTMLGSVTSPGIMFLTMMDLYLRMEEIRKEKTCEVSISYLEVYNERIRDLLAPSGFLPVREDSQKGCIVAGLSLHKPGTAKELMHMLDTGNQNRTQHPTDANAESSRSHAVFQVFVRQQDKSTGLSANVRVAKMSLIDLAGSERACVTSNRSARLREGANINRSLLALGNCINALADAKKNGHIPYRDSNLTRLLKDSLGGNCRTVMIAAVSPSSATSEDTHNTLKYADRAKSIKASLKRNVMNVGAHVSQYTRIIENLRQEVSELKNQNKVLQSSKASHAVTQQQASLPLGVPSAEEITRNISIGANYSQGFYIGMPPRPLGLQTDEVGLVFEERRDLRRTSTGYQALLSSYQLKKQLKRAELQRVKLFFSDPASCDKLSERLQRTLESIAQSEQLHSKRLQALNSPMDANTSRMQRLEAELKGGGSKINPVVEREIWGRHLEVELQDTRHQVKCLKRLCRTQHQHTANTERLVSSLLAAVRKQHFTLKGHNLATSDLVNQYEDLASLMGAPRVAWADQGPQAGSLTSESGDGSRDADESQIDSILEFPVLSCVPLTPARKLMELRRSATPTKSPASTRRKSLPTGGATPTCASLQRRLTRSSAEHISTPHSKKGVAPSSTICNAELPDSSKPPITHLFAEKTVCDNVRFSHETDINANETDKSRFATVPEQESGVQLVSDAEDIWAETFKLPTGVFPLPESPNPDVENSSSPVLDKISSRVTTETDIPHLDLNTSPCRQYSLPLKTGSPEALCAFSKISKNLSTPVNTLQCPINTSTVTRASSDCVGLPSQNGGTVTKSKTHPANPGTVTKTHSTLVLGGTVTKSRPTQLPLNSTITMETPTVRGATVTKSRPVTHGKENEGAHTLRRAMSFADEPQTPSTLGFKSFADAVKSPRRPVVNIWLQKTMEEGGNGLISRSPLSAKENLQLNAQTSVDLRRLTVAGSNFSKDAQIQSQNSFAAQALRRRSVSGSDIQLRQNPQQMGFSSALSISQQNQSNSKSSSRGGPSYMRSTHASTLRGRKRNHTGAPSEDVKSAGLTRVPVDTQNTNQIENNPRRIPVHKYRTLPKNHRSQSHSGVQGYV